MLIASLRGLHGRDEELTAAVKKDIKKVLFSLYQHECYSAWFRLQQSSTVYRKLRYSSIFLQFTVQCGTSKVCSTAVPLLLCHGCYCYQTLWYWNAKPSIVRY